MFLAKRTSLIFKHLVQKSYVRFLLATLAGSVIGVTFFFPYGWALVPLSLALLLYVISLSSAKESFALGTLFGFCVVGFSLSWGFMALPLDWLGIYNPVIGFCVVLGIWAVYCLILATTAGLWALLVRIYLNTWLVLLVAPALWLIDELFRAIVFSIAAWGSGSTFGADFSFGFIGYTLSWSPGLLWFARCGGVIALSWLAMTLGALLYLTATNKNLSKQAKLWSFFGICMCVLIIGYDAPNPLNIHINPPVIELNNLRIVPVTTELAPALQMTAPLLETNELKVADGILGALEQNPDVIILPEYSRFLKNENLLPAEIDTEIRDGLKKNNTLLIDSERSTVGRWGSILFFDGASGTVVAEQHKRFLIPLGEYLPQPLIAALDVVGLDHEAAGVVANRTYTPSNEPYANRVLTWRGLTFGVLACSESFSPFGYKEVSDAGANILINVASHSWLRGNSNLLYKETFSMAKIHAVYTGKPYIQATNYDPSFALFPGF